MLGLVQENASVPAVVRLFGLAESAIARFRQMLDLLVKRTLRYHLLSYLAQRAPSLVFLVVNICVLVAGSWLVFHDRLTVGSLVAFHILTNALGVQLRDALAISAAGLVGGRRLTRRIERGEGRRGVLGGGVENADLHDELIVTACRSRSATSPPVDLPGCRRSARSPDARRCWSRRR